MNTSRGSSPFATPSEGRRQRWHSLLLTLSVALGLGLALALSLGEAPHDLASATLCVNTTGAGGCYTEIQAALDAAGYGDVITVDAGTYTEHITMTNGVSIHGQGWPSTIIDGGYSMPRATVYIPSSVSASTVLSGVQITGGGTGNLTTSVSAYVQGGGIQIENASPSIVNTWVYSCTAKEGGGVFVNGGSPTFDNVPVWNSQAERGGGFYLQGAEVTIMSDFVGTNGTVQGNSATQDGGGIFMTGVTATLSGLRIWGNTASGSSSPSGGGAYISNTPNRITLRDNLIWLNSANWGGGIHTYNATNLEIVDNAINWNTASLDGGGAAFSQSAGLVQTNGFIGNTSSGGLGGGVTIFGSSTGPTLQGNWFQDNSAGAGGGLNLDTGAAPLVDANTFVTNTAPMGGGIYTYLAGAAKMTNNVVARNTASGAGGGVAVVESPLQLINNTIADNTLDGVWFAEAEGVVIVNNIISGNSDDGIEHYTLGVNPTISYTVAYNNVYGNANPYRDLAPGAGDMSVDPQFVGAGPNLTAYYHIQDTSPVSVTGSTSWAPERDLDGDLRIAGGSVSMGADELPGPALTVTKHADPDLVQDGALLTYTIHLTNTGGVTLTATITDVLSAQVTTTQPLIWASQVITAPGGVWTETVVFSVEMGYAGPLTNVVQVTTEEGATGVYTETSTAVVTPALMVTKQADPDPARAGEQLTYTICVTNTGNVDLQATVTDTLPPQVTSTGVLTWTPTITAFGGIWTKQLTVTVEMGYVGTLTNVVKVSTKEGATGEYTHITHSSAAPEYSTYIYLPAVMKNYH